MSTTLPLFWHLSSASQKDRIDASADLVSALEQFQTQFIPKDSPGTSDEEPKSDGLDALNAQDVSYSIRRLIRGLASPRESSRLGFAVALTEVTVHHSIGERLLIILLAAIPNRYSDMLTDCFYYYPFVQNAGIHDWTGRTRCLFRPPLRSDFCYPVRPFGPTDPSPNLCIYVDSCI